MKLKLCLGAAAASLCLAAPAMAAQAPWTLHDAIGAPKSLALSGSVRLRYEALSGQLRPGAGSGENLFAARTTLAAEYKAGPVRIGGEIWDSRAYGADNLTVLSTADVNAMEPVQAYVGFTATDPFGKGTRFDVELGRMTFNLGSRRLVATDDYRNTANSYTGGKAELRAPDNWSATAIFVMPGVRLPEDLPSLRRNQVVLDDESDAQLLWGGLVTKTGLPGRASLELEYYGLIERDAAGRPTRNRDLDTYGVHLFRGPTPGQLDYDFELIRQTGSIRAGAAASAALLDVSADFEHLEVGYQFAAPWKPHLSLEYDHVSGDHGAGKYNHFDTLFGMRGADFAVSGIFNAIARANIDSPGVRLEAAPSPRLDWTLHYALMHLDSATDTFSTTNVRDPSGRAGDFGGHLIDVRARYWLVPRNLRVDLNGIMVAKGRFLKEAPNAPRTGDTLFAGAALIALF